MTLTGGYNDAISRDALRKWYQEHYTPHGLVRNPVPTGQSTIIPPNFNPALGNVDWWRNPTRYSPNVTAGHTGPAGIGNRPFQPPTQTQTPNQVPIQPTFQPQPMQRDSDMRRPWESGSYPFGGRTYGFGFPFRPSGTSSRMRSSLPNPMTGAMGPPPQMPLPGWKPPKTLF